jgi:catechol 2,3-dioxygenase-like lactoylglutathione lyase family enzyme
MKYTHTNLVARDWRRLADFYVKVFGCTPVPPERNLSGEWLDKAVVMHGVHIRGVHLRLPGHGDAGPTLEVFQYDEETEAETPATNRPGYGHIAFAVDDVEATKEAVIAMGGGSVGEVVNVDLPGVGRLEFAYMHDPEGNIIEIQRLWG